MATFKRGMTGSARLTTGGEVMTGSQIDYLAVFWHLPVPVLLLTPDLVMADMNEAYLIAAGRPREDLLGCHVFDAFPDNPSDPGATGVRNMSASFGRVLATGEPDELALLRYDVEVPGSPGVFARRYWCPVNAPVFGQGGRVALIASCVEEVTDRVRKFAGGLAAEACRPACVAESVTSHAGRRAGASRGCPGRIRRHRSGASS